MRRAGALLYNGPFLAGSAGRMLKEQSIICFGGEDWWYHHPHSKNHLMKRFARAGNRVLFVNFHEQNTIPRAGKPLHQVVFGMGMVIPPILATETNDGLFFEHAAGGACQERPIV